MPVSVLTPPLSSISWGGARVANNAITVYFAAAGEKFGEYTGEAFNAYEKGRFMAAFDTIAAVANVTFTVVTTSAGADFKMVLDKNEFNNPETDGQMNPPGETAAGVGEFNALAGNYAPGGTLERGGSTFLVLVHEFLHGMGLAHPHDDGGGSTVMAGVTASNGVLGDFNLNQGVYTVMSYNDGYHSGLAGSKLDADGRFGGTMGPSALDIAVLQNLYGANTTAGAGNSVYVMPSTNVSGTGWLTIWDTSGVDEIQYNGTGSSTIDLRAATLQQEAGGGGWVSAAQGIAGGFTIANGVVIEKATGGSGNDKIIGNDGDNTLAGKQGNDTISGNAGHDKISGGNGHDFLYGDSLGVASVGNIANQVFRLYHATLNRDPDGAGHLGWTSSLLEGDRTLAQVSAGFVGSAEFQNTYGPLNNVAFTELLYQNVLGRAADAGGRAGWVAALDGGTSRADVVLGFSESNEFKNTTNVNANAFSAAHTAAVWTDDIFRLYHATLDRNPDLAGLTSWTDKLGSAERSLAQVSAGFVSSAEFQNIYGPLNNNGFVDQLYHNVLGRAGDANGLAAWSSRLESGTSRADVVLGFSQSQEFINATNGTLKTWVRALGVDDVLNGGAGTNTLSGGRFADTFVFTETDNGTNRVLDLEVWDRLQFDGFGYTTAADVRGHLTQSGADLAFADQGVSITFMNTQLSHIADDMIFV